MGDIDQEGEKWLRCWRELESIEYPEEWSQGEASTPSRTPSPECIIENKMMGGKLWMKVDKLVRVCILKHLEEWPPSILKHLEEWPPTPPPYMPRLGMFWMRSTERTIKHFVVKYPLGGPPVGIPPFVVGTFILRVFS